MTIHISKDTINGIIAWVIVTQFGALSGYLIAHLLG
jgi:hypothetical protein